MSATFLSHMDFCVLFILYMFVVAGCCSSLKRKRMFVS